MKVLVTGGAGFIGSHVADALLEDGHDVHVFDDLSGSVRANVPSGVTFHEVDVCSEKACSIIDAERFEALFHLAAQMDVRRSVADPVFDARVNVLGFLNLMEAGRRSGLKKVVFSSTGGAIYGEPEYVPQDESHPILPLSPYGITKFTTEKYLNYYRVTYGIEYVALRYANVYGPRQNPHGEAGVVAIFAERMLHGTQPVINGDGKQTRDYVFVKDVVAANMAALSYDGSDTFNIGTGIETDVNELFTIIRHHANPDVPQEHVPGKPGEQRRSVLAFDHARQHLNWTPRVGIAEGLRITVDWFADRVAAAK